MTKAAELVDTLRAKHGGQNVFIIGGGPSLLKILPDVHVLDNRNVISTNNAYQVFPNALFTHFGDRTWWMWHRERLAAEFKNPITSPAAAGVAQTRDMERFGVTVFQHGDRKGGYATERYKVNGNNSGHQAINIAGNIGFKNIILIGFDMSPTNPKTHWHEGHRRATNRGQYAGTMIPGLQALAPYQEKIGFKVWNANLESHLKCFDFTDINEWL